ncbi:MAG: PQQ-dependent sugar dehydrogenase, partial [Steroidobacteraceae bacterium]
IPSSSMRRELFVDLGTATNACEHRNRVPNSSGNTPCTERATRGGTWRYDANETGQSFSAAERYATGNRNGEGIAIDTAGRVLVTEHGRDQLLQDWPALYTAEQGSELPAEELVELKQGADYGWPECYYDGLQHKLVLAPEYGGDGGKSVGLCAQRTGPVAAFPAHWGPMAVLIVTDQRFPRAYREGAFISFHGSWNRSPKPQAGYKSSSSRYGMARPAARTSYLPMASPGPSRSRANQPIGRPVWQSARAARSTFRTTSTAGSGV